MLNPTPSIADGAESTFSSKWLPDNLMPSGLNAAFGHSLLFPHAK
jgi:hypothetical protein